MSATEANRRLIDKITFLERQASQGNDMRLASHEGDERNPQLQSAREPLSDAEIQHIADKHLCATAQFIGAGELWIDGTENFARAIEAAHGIGSNND